MKKICFLLLFPGVVFCQLEIRVLGSQDIPPSILYNGNIQKAVSFSDNNGKHLALITESGEQISKDESSFRGADIYAYQYTNVEGKWSMDWKVYDFIKDCELDLACNYIPDTFGVTDLDQDGEAEVWLMYELACTGDVSPSIMKVIMYENGIKHAVRGERRTLISENPKEYYGGDYAFGSTFKDAPDTFRKYAVKLWKTHVDMVRN